MVQFFKNLLRFRGGFGRSSGGGAFGNQAQDASALSHAYGAPPENETSIAIPLNAILRDLPKELRARMWRPGFAAQNVDVPLELILPQLTHGSVQMCFGDLRKAVPLVFAPQTDLDEVFFTLPQNEVYSRLDPALVSHWTNGSQVSQATEATSSEVTAAESAPQVVEESTAEITPDDANESQPAIAESSVIELASPLTNILSRSQSPASPASEETTRRPETNGFAAATRTASTGTGNSLPVIKVKLSMLWADWPATLGKHLADSRLGGADVSLPAELVKQGLKRGRLSFTWKELRSWIEAESISADSVQDATLLDLPLKIVAPLFLAQQSGHRPVKAKIQLDGDIPDPFANFIPKPAAQASTGSELKLDLPSRGRPLEVVSLGSELETQQFQRQFGLGSIDPYQVISRSRELPGVAGAIIALADGFPVVSDLPDDFDPDTLAAFVPQIFNKVSQFTGELRRGSLTSLSFTLEDVPWNIYRVQDIYFAAFGRSGESLATPELGALVSELSNPL